MGRGRQKAKQMKVARRLKYFSPETDLEALQRELSGGSQEAESDADDQYGASDYSDGYEDRYWDPGEWDPSDSR